MGTYFYIIIKYTQNKVLILTFLLQEDFTLYEKQTPQNYVPQLGEFSHLLFDFHIFVITFTWNPRSSSA